MHHVLRVATTGFLAATATVAAAGTCSSRLSPVLSWDQWGYSIASAMGFSVAGAGDVNRDGRPDVIVGSNYNSAIEGRVFVYLGVPPESSGPVAATPDGGETPGVPLRLAKGPDPGSMTLTWDESCLANEMDWELYEGAIGDYTSHLPRTCSTGGQTARSMLLSNGRAYYLVVPRSSDREGSYGTASAGERPASADACLPQAIAECP